MSNSLINNAFPSNGLPAEFFNMEVDVKPTSADQDFEDSRKNLIKMMATMQGAIAALSVIAYQSQMPDAYDVLNKMIKSYNESQEQLIRIYRIRALNKQDNVAEKPAVPSGGMVGETIDNRQQNVFVGTPADLAKVLEQIKKTHGE